MCEILFTRLKEAQPVKWIDYCSERAGINTEYWRQFRDDLPDSRSIAYPHALADLRQWKRDEMAKLNGYYNETRGHGKREHAAADLIGDIENASAIDKAASAQLRGLDECDLPVDRPLPFAVVPAVLRRACELSGGRYTFDDTSGRVTKLGEWTKPT